MIDDDEKIRRIAEAPLMALLSRISVFIIGGLSIWILSNVSDMKTDMASVLTRIEGNGKRIENLETWRNSFNAYARDN